MTRNLWNTVLVGAALLLLTLLAAPPANSDCDLWGWLTPVPHSLGDNGQAAFEESVRWMRGVSAGTVEVNGPNNPGDAICNDGWSVWGDYYNMTAGSPLDYRRDGQSNTAQIYSSNWYTQSDGFDWNWPPRIPYQGGAGTQYELDMALAHSRAAGVGPYAYTDPHPFVYDLGGRTLAMEHNGGLSSGTTYSTPMHTLIGTNYWKMQMFAERIFNGDDPSGHSLPENDSEEYAMLLMKYILLADNYASEDQGVNDLWAIARTIEKISGNQTLSGTYTSLNILLHTGNEIYAGAKTRNTNGYPIDHRLWFSYGYEPQAVQPTYGCIISGNDDPNGHLGTQQTYYLTMDHWEPFDEITDAEGTNPGQGYSFSMTKNNQAVSWSGPALLDDETLAPAYVNYAYHGRNPMYGEDISVAVAGDSAFLAVWENSDSVYYNYLDQMGLCERVPVKFFGADNNFKYRNPDVCDDGATSDKSFWIAYERGLANTTTSNKILIVKMTDNGTDYHGHYWTRGTPILMNADTTTEVAHPKIAWGHDRVVVTWQQKNANNRWRVHVAGYWATGSLSDCVLGEQTSTEQQTPDVAYVGEDGSYNPTQPVFMVSYLHKDLVGSNHGVYLSRILTNQTTFTVNSIGTTISYNPDNAIPAITNNGSGYFAVATKYAPTSTTHRLAVSQFHSPLTPPYLPYYTPIGTVSAATSTPNSPPSRFYEVSIADRLSEAGKVEVGYTDYDGVAVQSHIKYATADFNQSTITTSNAIDEDASTADLDPAIAINRWPSTSTTTQRLMLWDGHFTAGGRIIACFDPWHFTGGAASIGRPQQVSGVVQPVEGYRLNGGYPNPFNASTTLSFTLPVAANVKLSVYDVQGRLVKTLAEGMLTAGSHQAVFDGSNLASGLYLAKLTAGNFTAVQKLVLLK